MEFLTPEEVAEQCRVTTQTVLNWIHQRQLPAARLSPRVYRIPRVAFERFVQRARPTVPAELRQPSSTWQEGLARYEAYFGMSTQDMLGQHAEGRTPVLRSPEDETLYGMWVGAALLAVAAGFIPSPPTRAGIQSSQ